MRGPLIATRVPQTSEIPDPRLDPIPTLKHQARQQERPTLWAFLLVPRCLIGTTRVNCAAYSSWNIALISPNDLDWTGTGGVVLIAITWIL